MKVREVCSLDVRSCRPESNLATAASIMWEQDCGVVPVVNEKNRILGVVTDRDICMAVATRPLLASQITVGQLMTGKPLFCRLDDDIKAAVRTMTTSAVRRLPVLNESGELAGVLSVTDLVLAAKDSKIARHGDLTWTDTIPMIEAICRPRAAKATAPVDEKPILAIAHA